MLTVTDQITIAESELDEQFVRSSGPGGQNVNKTSTAVQLRFDVQGSNSLPADVRARLLRQAANRINSEGVLILEASEYRSQEQNRTAARERLVELVRQASRPPKKRRPTRPSRSARERRLQQKRQRSEKKSRRRFDPRRDL